MNRLTVALLAALDALIVVAIGIGIALVPLTVLWATQFHLAVDWSVFWKAAADIWLLGHGVNLTFSIGHATAASLGLAQVGVPFQVTIAVLGFSVLAVLMGVRTGGRVAQTGAVWTGAIAAVAAYGVAGVVIAITGGSALVTVSLWQSIVLPGFVFALGVGTGVGITLVRARGTVVLRQLSPSLRAGIASALRIGTAASALVIAAAAVLVAVLLFGNFGTVVGLYEQVQAGVLGAAVLTIAQLALIPNAVIWAASWLIGPGFAIGTGSSIGPVGTQVGPLPSLPLLGILPQGSLALGFAGLLVPVLAGFFAAMLMRSRLLRHSPTDAAPRPSAGGLILIVLGAAVVAGVQLGLLAWWSSGALGPGRLHDTGPIGWLVGACAAAAVAVGAVVGALTAARRAQ